jgi:hypothetical protein
VSLAAHARNIYSQFGEDGILAEVFDRIGTESRFCVEFGAADGLSCSNTANLWHVGWSALLIEADQTLYRKLVEETEYLADVTPVQMRVEPSGANSIDALLKTLAIETVDLMSIDVDGDDYAIWEAMEIRPRVVVIEYNQSVPPEVELRQATLGDCFGASALSLKNLGDAKGYDLVAMTRANLIFIDHAAQPYPLPPGDIEPIDLDEEFDRSALTYVVTDNQGRPAILGRPPWGWHKESYLHEAVGPELTRLPLHPIELFEAYQRIHGAAYFTNVDINLIDHRPEYNVHARLKALLGPAVVGINVANVGSHETHLLGWVAEFAEGCGYRCRMDPGLIILLKK